VTFNRFAVVTQTWEIYMLASPAFASTDGERAVDISVRVNMCISLGVVYLGVRAHVEGRWDGEGGEADRVVNRAINEVTSFAPE
jgi:hypothetical protein